MYVCDLGVRVRWRTRKGLDLFCAEGEKKMKFFEIEVGPRGVAPPNSSTKFLATPVQKQNSYRLKRCGESRLFVTYVGRSTLWNLRKDGHVHLLLSHKKLQNLHSIEMSMSDNAKVVGIISA